MGEAKRKRQCADEVLPNGICLERSRPTPEGRQIGVMLADWADAGEPVARQSFPAMPPKCKSCAFRRGMVPNGCPETALDAVGAIVEDVRFMCHMNFDDDGRTTEVCAGWLFAKESREARKMADFLDHKMPDMPACSPETKAYLDEERRKIRARKR